jgi:hypothetical protein
MRRLTVFIITLFSVFTSIPAHAYADPSGGALFQVLMPILAAMWAMWMIVANRIRRSVRRLFHKGEDTSTQDVSIPAFPAAVEDKHD